MDLARGLEYLQGKGVAHRDIKPENVGFDSHGTAKLFDFCFARKFSPADGIDERQPTAFCGTLRYMAPEVAKSEPYGLNVDIYSYGIILWELCSLCKPFKDYRYKDLHEQVICGTVRPKIDPSWPEALAELMAQCWSACPSDRPAVDEILDSLLFVIQSGEQGFRSGGGLKRLGSQRMLSVGGKKESSTCSPMVRRKSSIKNMKRTLSNLF